MDLVAVATACLVDEGGVIGARSFDRLEEAIDRHRRDPRLGEEVRRLLIFARYLAEVADAYDVARRVVEAACTATPALIAQAAECEQPSSLTPRRAPVID